jgi:hypothetical protein
MNLNSGKERIRHMFPSEADIDWEKISILASIGTVLIGYGSGDTIRWKVSAEIRRLRIEEITCQPEAAGDHHLQSKAFMRRSDKGRCRCGCILLNCFAVAFKKDRYYETA